MYVCQNPNGSWHSYLKLSINKKVYYICKRNFIPYHELIKNFKKHPSASLPKYQINQHFYVFYKIKAQVIILGINSDKIIDVDLWKNPKSDQILLVFI